MNTSSGNMDRLELDEIEVGHAQWNNVMEPDEHFDDVSSAGGSVDQRYSHQPGHQFAASPISPTRPGPQNHPSLRKPDGDPSSSRASSFRGFSSTDLRAAGGTVQARQRPARRMSWAGSSPAKNTRGKSSSAHDYASSATKKAEKLSFTSLRHVVKTYLDDDESSEDEEVGFILSVSGGAEKKRQSSNRSLASADSASADGEEAKQENRPDSRASCSSLQKIFGALPDVIGRDDRSDCGKQETSSCCSSMRSLLNDVGSIDLDVGSQDDSEIRAASAIVSAALTEQGGRGTGPRRRSSLTGSHIVTDGGRIQPRQRRQRRSSCSSSFGGRLGIVSSLQSLDNDVSGTSQSSGHHHGGRLAGRPMKRMSWAATGSVQQTLKDLSDLVDDDDDSSYGDDNVDGAAREQSALSRTISSASLQKVADVLPQMDRHVDRPHHDDFGQGEFLRGNVHLPSVDAAKSSNNATACSRNTTANPIHGELYADFGCTVDSSEDEDDNDDNSELLVDFSRDSHPQNTDAPSEIARSRNTTRTISERGLFKFMGRRQGSVEVQR